MTNKYCNIILPLFLFLFVAVLTTACNDPKGKDADNPESGEIFDFSTKTTYTLNVNYSVPKGYKVYFEVYAENPFTADMSLKKGLSALDKGYTNENGSYSYKIIIPSSVKKLYIYSPYAGVPQLLTADVINGILTAADVPSKSGSSGLKSSGNGIFSSDFANMPIPTKFLGKWLNSSQDVEIPNVPRYLLYNGSARIWGRPEYLTYQYQPAFPGNKPSLNITPEIYDAINAVLPGDNGKPVEERFLQNGDINITQETEISLYLIEDLCLNLNTIAYYCYKTGNAPSSVSDIKTQVIALPNAKILRSRSTYGYFDNILDYGALLPGEGIILHYFDENGIDQGTKFPAGTSIGWILYSNGYKYSYLGSPVEYYNGMPMQKGRVEVGEGAVYSSATLMNGYPHMAIFKSGDLIISSFEDGKKTNDAQFRDYKDVILNIAASEPSAITPGIPDANPEEPEDIEVKYRGILSFEDNWPYMGDFDMNDVVVKYVSTVKYNSSNQVVSTTDSITLLWSGAALDNSFAYQNLNLDKSHATVTFSGGVGSPNIEDNNIIRLASNILSYANQKEKKTFVVETKFTTPINKNDFIHPPYNPFVMIKGQKDMEVHLTNAKPTSYADLKWFGFGKDSSDPEKGLYYITYDNNGDQMPFAIDIIFKNEADLNKYVIPAETKPINTYYPGFMKWLKSNGKESQDWYLNPVGK